MMLGRFCAAALAACLLASPVLAVSVTEAVFDSRPMANVTEPTVLHYRYDLRGSTIPEPYASRGKVEVREIGADGTKQVWFDLFEGEARRTFGPVAAKDQNPLVLVFLQLDVNEMGNLTGGAASYFQQQIRSTFNAPAEAEPIEIELDGRKLPATRVRMRPFESDPSIERFPVFRHKTYEFVVAEGVPGGIWRIATSTPDPKASGAILERSFTFERVGP